MPIVRADGPERAAEPHTRAAIPAWTCRSRRQAKLIVALGPTLRAAGLDTKILGYDHNWSTHPDDIATTPPGEDPETEYPTELLSSRAGALDRRHRVPLLLRRPEPPDRAARAVPGQGHLVHRVLGLARADRPAGAVLLRHAQVARAQPRARRHAQLGARPSSTGTSRSTRDGGPHRGGCDTCTGVVTVGPGGTVTQNAEYYTLGHLARFVQPGRGADRQHLVRHHRLERADHGRRVPQPATARPRSSCTTRTTTRAASPSPQGGQSFDYTLPGGALATFTWPDVARARRRPAAA